MCVNNLESLISDSLYGRLFACGVDRRLCEGDVQTSICVWCGQTSVWGRCPDVYLRVVWTDVCVREMSRRLFACGVDRCLCEGDVQTSICVWCEQTSVWGRRPDVYLCVMWTDVCVRETSRRLFACGVDRRLCEGDVQMSICVWCGQTSVREMSRRLFACDVDRRLCEGDVQMSICVWCGQTSVWGRCPDVYLRVMWTDVCVREMSRRLFACDVDRRLCEGDVQTPICVWCGQTSVWGRRPDVYLRVMWTDVCVRETSRRLFACGVDRCLCEGDVQMSICMWCGQMSVWGRCPDIYLRVVWTDVCVREMSRCLFVCGVDRRLCEGDVQTSICVWCGQTSVWGRHPDIYLHVVWTDVYVRETSRCLFACGVDRRLCEGDVQTSICVWCGQTSVWGRRPDIYLRVVWTDVCVRETSRRLFVCGVDRRLCEGDIQTSICVWCGQTSMWGRRPDVYLRVVWTDVCVRETSRRLFACGVDRRLCEGDVQTSICVWCGQTSVWGRRPDVYLRVVWTDVCVREMSRCLFVCGVDRRLCEGDVQTSICVWCGQTSVWGRHPDIYLHVVWTDVCVREMSRRLFACGVDRRLWGRRPDVYLCVVWTDVCVRETSRRLFVCGVDRRLCEGDVQTSICVWCGQTSVWGRCPDVYLCVVWTDVSVRETSRRLFACGVVRCLCEGDVQTSICVWCGQTSLWGRCPDVYLRVVWTDVCVRETSRRLFACGVDRHLCEGDVQTSICVWCGQTSVWGRCPDVYLRVVWTDVCVRETSRRLFVCGVDRRLCEGDVQTSICVWCGQTSMWGRRPDVYLRVVWTDVCVRETSRRLFACGVDRRLCEGDVQTSICVWCGQTSVWGRRPDVYLRVVWTDVCVRETSRRLFVCGVDRRLCEGDVQTSICVWCGQTSVWGRRPDVYLCVVWTDVCVRETSRRLFVCGVDRRLCEGDVQTLTELVKLSWPHVEVSIAAGFH